MTGYPPSFIATVGTCSPIKISHSRKWPDTGHQTADTGNSKSKMFWTIGESDRDNQEMLLVFTYNHVSSHIPCDVDQLPAVGRR